MRKTIEAKAAYLYSNMHIQCHRTIAPTQCLISHPENYLLKRHFRVCIEITLDHKTANFNASVIQITLVFA